MEPAYHRPKFKTRRCKSCDGTGMAVDKPTTPTFGAIVIALLSGFCIWANARWSFMLPVLWVVILERGWWHNRREESLERRADVRGSGTDSILALQAALDQYRDTGGEDKLRL